MPVSKHGRHQDLVAVVFGQGKGLSATSPTAAMWPRPLYLCGITAQRAILSLCAGKGYTIKEMAETLGSFLDLNYQFDTTKLAGFQRGVMDASLSQKLNRI